MGDCGKVGTQIQTWRTREAFWRMQQLLVSQRMRRGSPGSGRELRQRESHMQRPNGKEKWGRRRGRGADLNHTANAWVGQDVDSILGEPILEKRTGPHQRVSSEATVQSLLSHLGL